MNIKQYTNMYTYTNHLLSLIFITIAMFFNHKTSTMNIFFYAFKGIEINTICFLKTFHFKLQIESYSSTPLVNKWLNFIFINTPIKCTRNNDKNIISSALLIKIMEDILFSTIMFLWGIFLFVILILILFFHFILFPITM